MGAVSAPRAVLACTFVCGLALVPGVAQAQKTDARRALEMLRFATHPEIRPGALELGFSGAFGWVEGTSSATVAVRAAQFYAAGAGRAALEAELGYSREGPLDLLEAGGSIGWLAHPSPGPVYPFVALAGGVREEWLGSFRLARYPVGANVGLRMLAGNGALMRIEYRYRRVLHDPVADFTEHQVLSGFSLLFGNHP